MPRFTEQEKEIINSKLLIEGEKLFALHGLKKVTVDDLVAAVNISKGSFYAFYPSKEHLYVEINFRLQKELFTSIETTIKKKKYKNHRDLAKDVIMLSLTGVITSPILSQIDLSLMDYLQRKISSDIFENHMYSDIRILEILEDLGVVFLVPHTVIIKSLYSVLSCLEQFKEDEELNMIQNLLVNGIIQHSSRVIILFGYLTGKWRRYS
ncbi:MAG: TetR/AcrR family transcriptional regulator [Hungatella sp.]